MKGPTSVLLIMGLEIQLLGMSSLLFWVSLICFASLLSTALCVVLLINNVSQRSSTRALRARVGGAPLLRKSTHTRKFGNHVTDRPTDRPSAPQAYQCLLSHFLATLGAQEKADCTSMLSSIDSCQNRVSADQYHLTVSRAQVSTHRGRVFFEVIR